MSVIVVKGAWLASSTASWSTNSSLHKEQTKK